MIIVLGECLLARAEGTSKSRMVPSSRGCKRDDDTVMMVAVVVVSGRACPLKEHS